MATNKYIIQLVVDVGNGEAKVKGVAKVFDKLSTSAERAKKSVSGAKKATDGMGGAAGIAGAAAAELGRTISDMPYGINAVTNNISQLGSMFTLLVSSSGGVKKAFENLGKVLTGPAGILLLFQAAVALIDVFAKKSKKAKDEATQFNLEMEAQASALKTVAEAFRSANATEAKREDLLKKNKQLGEDILQGYKQQLLSASEIAKLAEIEASILENKEALQKSTKDREAERKALEEQLLDIAKEEEATQKRKLNLMRKGMTEEEAINEINRARVGFYGGQESSATSFVALARERGEIERQISAIMEEQQQAADAIVEAEREAAKLRKLAEMRASAENKLFDEQLDLKEDLIEADLKRLQDSEVNTLEAQRELQKQLYDLNVQRIKEQEKRELEGITDPETIRLIKEKYKVISDAAALDFRKALEETLDSPIPVKLIPAITGDDLLDGPEQTELQKSAAKALVKVGKAAEKGLKDYVDSKGESNWFVDTFGISQEKFENTAKQVQQGLNATFDLIGAQMDRELALEETKTIKLNDQLRERLRNEELTAEARDKINQQIAKNEAALVEKQNEIEKKKFNLNKAQGISNAVINTAVGVSKVLPNIPLAAFIGALGAAQIATIASQTFVPKAMPTPNLSSQGGGGAGSQAPDFNVIGGSGRSQLAEAISGVQNGPIKAYVVSSDVSSAQELDRKIVAGASI